MPEIEARLKFSQVMCRAFQWDHTGKTFYGWTITFVVVATIFLGLVWGYWHKEKLEKLRENQAVVSFRNAQLYALDAAKATPKAGDITLALAIRDLGQKVKEEYPPNLYGLAFHGFTALFQRGISDLELSSKIEPIFVELNALSQPEYAQQIIRGKAQERFFSEYYKKKHELAYISESNQLFNDIWLIFPIREQSRKAYSVLVNYLLHDEHLRDFLYEWDQEILLVLEGELKQAIHPVPEIKETFWAQRTFWQHFKLFEKLILGLAGLGIAFWSFFYYLKETWAYPQPWHVRWNILILLLVVYWSIPICVTLLYFFSRQVWRLTKAILTADFGRFVAILIFKQEAVSGSARKDVIQELEILYGRASLLLESLRLEALAEPQPASETEEEPPLSPTQKRIKRVEEDMGGLMKEIEALRAEEGQKTSEDSFNSFRGALSSSRDKIRQMRAFMD